MESDCSSVLRNTGGRRKRGPWNESERAVERHSTHGERGKYLIWHTGLVKDQTNHDLSLKKFHYYGEREKVRHTSYNCTDELKAANLGIGIQIPKEIREAMKPLYPIMKKSQGRG